MGVQSDGSPKVGDKASVGDKSYSQHVATWMFALGGIATTSFLFFELLRTDGGAPTATRIAVIGCAVICWTAVLLHERLRNVYPLVILSAVIGIHAIVPFIPSVYGGSVLAGFLITLTWTGLTLPARYNLLVAAYAPIAAHFGGAEWVFGVEDMTRPGQLSVALLIAYLTIPVGFGAAVQMMIRASVRRLESQVRVFESRQGELVESLRRNADELEASREQLFQAQKLKTVGTMASGLAHELNNILTPVRGLAELLVSGVDQEQGQRYGQRILDSAISASQITGALLTYTRQGTFQPVRSNVRQLLQGQILPVLSKSLPRGVWMRVDLARNVSVDVDRVLFQQCITNLVFNAVDAMPDGGEIRIALSTSSQPCGEGPNPKDGVPRSVEITVTDEGSGIEADHVDRIFDPFFTTKGVGAGTGLGLAMVQGTVERHGGRVEVDTEVGRGSTFTIRLPIADPDAMTETPWPILAGEPKGPVVVVVTEDDDSLDEFEELLEHTECSPLCTNDAKAARNLLTDMGDRISLLILDLDIEAVDASQLFRSMREMLPELPVIIISDEPMGPVIQRMIGVGPTRSIRKPVDPGLFATVLTDLLHPETTYARDFTPIPLSPGQSGSLRRRL